MAMEVIVHIANEDPIVAEIDDWPDPTHQTLKLVNPRRRDGRPLHYITEGATAFVFPWTRITFIEIMETGDEQEVVEFFRE